MALIFSRLARNHIKNGYFPTDDETLARLQSALVPGLNHRLGGTSSTGTMRLLDPCCGTGAALADLAAHLVEQQTARSQPSLVETYGIELDSERAWEAKKLLYRAMHTDVEDAVVKPRTVNLLFLNPPYGFGVSDAANSDRQTSVTREKAERLERTFLKRTVPTLAPGGVLIFIVPFYALDDEIRNYLARHFKRLRFFMAPEQQFQQCVVLGEKIKPLGYPDKAGVAMLTRAQAGEFKNQVLPQTWDDEPYQVPVSHDAEFDFHAVRIEAKQLNDELQRFEAQLLWNNFDRFFNQARAQARRPLRDMTQWHLALALAAGQVTGRITSAGGRTFLIKGDTFKRKDRSVVIETDEQGNVSEVVTMLDKFVPIINAIEFTPGPNLGQIVRIS
jgi:tRNA1(Val) A37 N6-methylase TrmN6